MGGDDETKKTPPPKVRVRGGGVPIEYPMLNHENYGLWAMRKKIIMQSLCVWEAIDDTAAVDAEKVHGTMVVFSQAMPYEVKMTIAEKEPAKEAWDAIKEMSIGEDRVKKVRAQVLKKKFDQLKKERAFVAEKEEPSGIKEKKRERKALVPLSRKKRNQRRRRRKNGKHSLLVRQGIEINEGKEEGTESTRSSFKKKEKSTKEKMMNWKDFVSKQVEKLRVELRKVEEENSRLDAKVLLHEVLAEQSPIAEVTISNIGGILMSGAVEACLNEERKRMDEMCSIPQLVGPLEEVLLQGQCSFHVSDADVKSQGKKRYLSGLDCSDVVSKVVAVSARNNYEIGNMIAEAMSKVDRKGVVTLEGQKAFARKSLRECGMAECDLTQAPILGRLKFLEMRERIGLRTLLA